MNALGQPLQLLRLAPNRMKAATDDQGNLVGWVYRAKDRDVPYSVDEVLHIRNDNPSDPIYGMGIVEAIMREAELDIAIGEHVVGFFQNGARISGVLTVKETVPDHVFDRLVAQFNEEYQGRGNAFKTLIAEQSLDFKPVSAPTGQLGLKEISDLSKDAIFKAFGVPDPLAGGLMENANYKMEEARFNFADIMEGEAILFEEDLTMQIVSRWGQLKLDINVDYAEPKSAKVQRSKMSVGTGTSLNQLLRMQGEPKSDEPWADEPLLPSTVKPASQIFAAPVAPAPGLRVDAVGTAVEEEPPALPPPPADKPVDPAAASAGNKPVLAKPKMAVPVPGNVDIRARFDDLASRYPGLKSPLLGIAAEATSAFAGAPVIDVPNHPDVPGWASKAAGHQHEELAMPEDLPPNVERDHVQAIIDGQARLLVEGVRLLESPFKRFLDEQHNRVLARLRAYGPTKHQGAATGLRDKKELTSGALFPKDQEDAFLKDMYLPILDELGKQAVEIPAAILGSSISWDIENPYIEHQRLRLATQITRINETTRGKIVDQVEVALKRGYSIPQIANGVPDEGFGGLKAVFDGNAVRANSIARTETALALNASSIATYRSASIQSVYVLDGTGDVPCAEANGSTWTLDRADLDPIAHPNCVRAFAPVTPDPGSIEG
jgi:hypothetical protein